MSGNNYICSSRNIEKIHFQSYNEDNGQVTVILKGSCSGCPSSTATLKGGVENLLKSHIPEINEVVALNG